MIVRWEDRDWEWQPTKITVAQARQVQAFTGKGLRSWMAGVDDGQADSLVALWWLIRDQNGQPVPIDSIEAGFDLNGFLQASIASVEAELRRRMSKAAGVEADPKAGSKPASRRAKKTPTSAGTATSTSSS